MRNNLTILLVTGVLIVASAPSFAGTDSTKSEYYIEIGRDASQTEAAKQWDELVKNNKTILGNLHFYPKAIMHAGNAISTRIQAGPIAEKDKAQKICTKLFKEDVPCFVIEGLSAAPPTSVENFSEESMHPVNVVRLPWLSPETPPAPIQELPVASVPAAKPQPSEPQDTSRQAEVNVAEAIRVPLTQSEDQQRNAQVVVKSLPTLNPTFSANNGKYSNESSDSGAGWLTVQSFPDDESASSFWDEIRRVVPKQTKKLHIHILPIMQNQSKTSLNIGPFASSSDAYNFCRNGIQAKEKGLDCSFSNTEPSINSIAATEPTTRHRPIENPPIVVPLTPVRQYWIQVASAPSYSEALHMWEDIKDKDEDIVGNMRNSISAASNDPNTYVVRVGPISSNDDAIKSCSQIQQRGIDCRVILYSTSVGVH